MPPCTCLGPNVCLKNVWKFRIWSVWPEFATWGSGALLGLSDWRSEAAAVALHAQYLMQTYRHTKVSVSVPRIKATPGGEAIEYPVSDRELVQMITALRLFLPDVGIAVSTREAPELRNHLIGLGVTQMSAGSKTNPGGVCHGIRDLKTV